MSLFTHPEFDNHEQVVFCHDEKAGLKAIISIHNLNRGPALGGCRRWPYASEDEALTDVLRLSRGMTYKAALAELPFGGGKSVILAEDGQDPAALYDAMGRFVETLGGRYTAAEDVGTSVENVETMGRHTSHIAGVPAGGAGDPSPATAYGTLHGIKAAVRHHLGKDSLDDVSIAVQGLGHVGYNLCRYLASEGARLYVSDINEEAVVQAVRERPRVALGVPPADGRVGAEPRREGLRRRDAAAERAGPRGLLVAGERRGDREVRRRQVVLESDPGEQAGAEGELGVRPRGVARPHLLLAMRPPDRDGLRPRPCHPRRKAALR